MQKTTLRGERKSIFKTKKTIHADTGALERRILLENVLCTSGMLSTDSLLSTLKTFFLPSFPCSLFLCLSLILSSPLLPFYLSTQIFLFTVTFSTSGWSTVTMKFGPSAKQMENSRILD